MQLVNVIEEPEDATVMASRGDIHLLEVAGGGHFVSWPTPVGGRIGVSFLALDKADAFFNDMADGEFEWARVGAKANNG